MSPFEMSSQLTVRLDGIRAILMAHHSAGSLMPSAAKGTERETLVREFLGRVFPAPIRFGRGAIVDSAGTRSGELDVVAEFPFFPSFPTPGAAERLYLAESVSFVIEVKSDLARQWDQVEQSVKQVHPLRRQWSSHLGFAGGHLSIGDASESRIRFVSVGFAGDRTLEDLEKRLLDTPEDRRPDAALVIESGAYCGLLTGTRGFGAAGLFGLCADASHFAVNVLVAYPNFSAYLGGSQGAG